MYEYYVCGAVVCAVCSHLLGASEVFTQGYNHSGMASEAPSQEAALYSVIHLTGMRSSVAMGLCAFEMQVGFRDEICIQAARLGGALRVLLSAFPCAEDAPS